MTTLPRYDDGTADELLAERYGIPNPHRGECTVGDIGAGLLAGMGTILAISIVLGVMGAAVSVVVAGAHGWIAVASFAPIVAIPVLLVIGAPTAALAAWLLRPVPWEWLHLVVFGLLGAAAAAGYAVVTTAGAPHADAWVAFAMAFPYAAPTAVVARFVGRRAAIRRFARETGFPAAPRGDDE